jgi:NAD+ diphosphatase
MPKSPREIPLTYSGSLLDRMSEQRGETALIDRLRSGPDPRTLVLAGEAFILAKRGEGFDAGLTQEEISAVGEPLESALLGKTTDEHGRFAIAIPPERIDAIKANGKFIVVDLRSIALQGLVPPEDLSRLATAKALLFWHERHRFCSNCGTPTKVSQAGWRRDCTKCSAQHFPRTDPCVIMLAIYQDKCLLARQTRFPPGMWSALAGFVEPGESIEEAVRRETLEEAGIGSSRVAYFASQPWPFPMSIMFGCFTEATSDRLKIDEVELEAARWVTRDECRLLLSGQHPARMFAPPPIAIAHHLIKAFVERGDSLFS